MAKNHDNIWMCTARMHRWRLRVLICSFGHFATFTSFSIAVENAAKLQCFWSCDAVTSTNWCLQMIVAHSSMSSSRLARIQCCWWLKSPTPCHQRWRKTLVPHLFQMLSFAFRMRDICLHSPHFSYMFLTYFRLLVLKFFFPFLLFPSFLYWCVLFFSVACGMYCFFLCVPPCLHIHLQVGECKQPNF